MWYLFISFAIYSYEASEARHCIMEGKTESSVMSLDESLVIAEIMDEIMKQLDVVHFKNKWQSVVH